MYGRKASLLLLEMCRSGLWVLRCCDQAELYLPSVMKYGKMQRRMAKSSCGYVWWTLSTHLFLRPGPISHIATQSSSSPHPLLLLVSLTSLSLPQLRATPSPILLQRPPHAIHVLGKCLLRRSISTTLPQSRSSHSLPPASSIQARVLHVRPEGHPATEFLWMWSGARSAAKVALPARAHSPVRHLARVRMLLARGREECCAS